MSLALTVYDNGDHTCLVWLPTDHQPTKNCRGFTIRKTQNGQQDYLHGFVGFSDDDKLDPNAKWKFPVQRYMWWDYAIKPGDKVQYCVIPVVGPDKDHLSLDEADASPVTPELEITGQCTPHLSTYFNKGIVAAQWVSRALDSQPKGAKITNLVATVGNNLRNALSGLLRPEILKLLADAKAQNGKIYAALYELNDPELIPALLALGMNCNLILSNGAFKSNTPPNNDENAAVRKQLAGHVNLINRIVTTGHFGHNKFVVFCDSSGTPQRVLTGSTNWTSSGLCTQANNSVIIDDASVAADYLAYWKRIQAAGNAYPTAYIDANSAASTFQVDGASITLWCVPTSAAQDLDFARKLISGAQQGILFLFFNPGTFQTDPEHMTLLQNILNRHQQGQSDYNPNLYMCGVVNQDIPMLTEAGAPTKGGAKGTKPPAASMDPSASPAPVTLFRNGTQPPTRLSQDVLVPHNIKSQFHDWEKELLGASMVNIHSKVIVIDPFGAKPVLMTGSHNLGYKASQSNDDNLVIIQGNAPLAAAYAINIVAIYQTYRWNAYVEANRTNTATVWHGLVDNDTWQAGYLSGQELQELEFWSSGVPEVAVPAVAAAGHSPSAAPKSPHRVHGVSAHPKHAAPPAHKPAHKH